MQAGKKTVLWLLTVYILSAACYAPLGLRRLGAEVPDVLLSLRYGFIVTPALVSTVFLVREHDLKNYLSASFKKLSIKETALCVASAFTGLALAYGYSRMVKTDLLRDAYPTVPSVFIGCGYLFMTALLEEAAWRGFLFRRIATEGKETAAALLTGVAWALWHIPMWSVRNGAGLREILFLLAWAVLLAVILGTFYWRFRNLISAALLHMTFNMCFLAPVKYNSVVVLLGILVYCVCRKFTRPDK